MAIIAVFKLWLVCSFQTYEIRYIANLLNDFSFHGLIISYRKNTLDRSSLIKLRVCVRKTEGGEGERGVGRGAEGLAEAPALPQAAPGI